MKYEIKGDRQKMRGILGFCSWLFDEPFAENGQYTLACGRIYRFSLDGALINVRNIRSEDKHLFRNVEFKRDPRGAKSRPILAD